MNNHRRTLPTTPAHQLDRRAARQTWLVDQLWAEEAVGILGGEPKCCKSLFALHLALAVASGQPFLIHHPVANPGQVLFYAAEDAEHIVGDRIRRIASATSIDLTTTPLTFITIPTLRLDNDRDIDALDATIAQHHPRLVVLDPFVRLHRKDENHAGDIAPILDSLRALQRRHHTAILIVHHARKNGSTRAGQALRGSSEFHAWGDCNLYLRWRRRDLILSVEHRAAQAIDDLNLELRQNEDHLQLHICNPTTTDHAPTMPSHYKRILDCLTNAAHPLTRSQLRTHIGIRNATLGNYLDELCAQGHITRTQAGYTIAAAPGAA